MTQGLETYDIAGVGQLVAALGQPAYRARQILEWVYGRGAGSYGDMSNLPASLRAQLAEQAPLWFPRIANRQVSADGTRKYVFELADGCLVESVGIPSGGASGSDEGSGAGDVRAARAAGSAGADAARTAGAAEAAGAEGAGAGDVRAAGSARSAGSRRSAAGDGGRGSATGAGGRGSGAGTGGRKKAGSKPDADASGRLTVCFSTQVGCAFACRFCATGTQGFTRNLHPGEIALQVVAVAQDFGMRASNAVAMGQGEPFANYDATLAALRLINADFGPRVGARHLTVSTCGIDSAIRRFASEPEQFTLAVSLHSAIQKTRDSLMPKMAGIPLGRLRTALVDYVAESGRRVSFEYLLAGGTNDDQAHLDALLEFCSGLKCHVNLLPVNHIEGSPLVPAAPGTAQAWLAALEGAGVAASLRTSRGSDICGACGQLRNALN